ncbi:SDR family oxidoreductase [Nocardiopsis exhalans]|uniref:SDR family oxidoreductase n=1 Tax=Nocardiopsis exhalans TaxID=163604 RepID=A0ABY5D0X3_9ACTN|nr:SDR family oxidoreductase [Nocardiopsis exhalans]USY17346.1 SDR family oxidoreductase [Nocardiopsis exhalans]
MSVVVTGATGHLGRLVVESLLERGYPAADITATGRSTDKLADLAERGVTVRHADFEDRASLREAFEGADAVLLVSGSELGKRVEQHRNAIEAAKEAGVGHLVYTSAPRASDTTLILAPEHKATEEILAASGLSHTILRNGWYNENFEQVLEQAREHGALIGSAGEGRTASAARRDLAEAAAVVLTDPAPHAGAVYELSGDTAWTREELAGYVSELLGREIVYRDLSHEEHEAVLTGAGLDAGTAGFVVGLDRNTRDGELSATSGTLTKLIGRPTTPVAETLRLLA